jgi:hypothetical protein
MNIIIDIGHPGHVHLFRNFYFAACSKHSITVTSRDSKIINHLLAYYKIPFISLGKKKDSLAGKAFTILRDDFQLLRLVRKHKIDIGISSGIVLSHISGLSKIKTMIFDDDDDAVEPLLVKFGHPFADSVVSPESITRKAKNTVSYSGTHELAYLHPAYFTPDPAVLKDYGINAGEKYFILRFVAFKGHHDVGQSGVSYEQKLKLTELLKGYGRVFITAEREIEPELEQYRVPVPPEKMHSFMAFSTMFLGDSQTMTSEAAILGVPALKCNTFAGKLSVPNELEQKYGLCYSYQPSDFDKFYQHVESLLSRPDLKQEWKQKKEKFLADKIDVTAFMVWFVENYPESKRIMKENPDYQYRFK